MKANPYNYTLNLNLNEANNICSYLFINTYELVNYCKEYNYYGINSYIIIDNWNYNSFLLDELPSTEIIEGELSLLGITYFGIDPSTIKKRKKIQTIKRNVLAFKIFFIIKIIFYFFWLFWFCIFITIDHDEEIDPFFIIVLILILFEIIMNLISLILRINIIHNFIFKIIYKNEDKDYKYKFQIIFYMFNILIFSSTFIQFIYIKIKKHFNFGDFIKIEINRSTDNIPTKNNDKSDDTINMERFNINELINPDINNKNNKSKQKEEIKSPINTKNEINNDINKPKVTIENPNLLNINKKNEIENNEIEFTERIECPLNIININKKN